MIGFSRGDRTGGSIFPAVWSAQLAARAEGVGSALTSVLGIFHGAEAMQHPGRARAGGARCAACTPGSRSATGLRAASRAAQILIASGSPAQATSTSAVASGSAAARSSPHDP